MGLEFIDRVRKTSIATGIVVALVVWARFGSWAAAGFLAGCAWSLVNLHVLRVLVSLIVGDSTRSNLRIAAVLVVKVPVLYGAGYLLLAGGRLPIAALLAGFGWPLAVVVLKAAGRIMLGLDRTERALGSVGARSSRKGA